MFLGVMWRTSEAIAAIAEKVTLSRNMKADPEPVDADTELVNRIPESIVEAIYTQRMREETNHADDAADCTGEDENDVAELFGNYGEEREEAVRAEPRDRHLRDSGQVESRRSSAIHPVPPLRVPEPPDRDTRDHGERRRLRRLRPPQAPATQREPTIQRPDRSLFGWHHGPDEYLN